MTITLLKGFRAAGVRFLRQDPSSQLWMDVGDQLARTKISQALRDNTNPSNDPININTGKDTENRSKRKLAAPTRNNRERKPFLSPEVIRDHDQTPAITSQIRSNIREVSPVPSVKKVSSVKILSPSVAKNLMVPSFDSSPSITRYEPRSVRSGIVCSGTSYYVSPADASLFEILEHEKTEDNNNFAMSLWSSSPKRLVDPFALPELPSSEGPLRLPSISKGLDNDDGLIDFSDVSTLDDGSTSAQSYPREVSPIPLPIFPLLNESITDGGDTRSSSPVEDFDDHLLTFAFSDYANVNPAFESHNTPCIRFRNRHALKT